MSEIQNKAVLLLEQTEGELAGQSPADRSALFLRQALKLYYALGGDDATAIALAKAARSSVRVRVDTAVAEVMFELAAASYLNDIDMMQAAYNRLDVELKVPRR